MKLKDGLGVWLLLGGAGPFALAIALIALRSITTASNLAFVFLVCTIVVAELGGRLPALVAALTSTMADWPFSSRSTRHRFGRRRLRLPEEGGQLPLDTDQGALSLELWEGDPAGLDVDQWRTLSIAVAILGLRFARARAA